jgi:hypothetical protein
MYGGSMSNPNDKLALTNNQKNVLAMIFAVLSLCDARTAITALVAAFAGTLEDLRTAANDIVAVAKKKVGATMGVISIREEAEDVLLDLLVSASSSLFAYASKNKQTALKDQVAIKRWRLARLPDVEFRLKVESIIELATANASNIVAFGTDAAAITKLQTAYAAYKKAAAAVPEGQSTRSGSVENLKDLFLEADTVLKEQLDKLVENIQTSQPVFYKEYRTARVIHDVGGSQADETPPAPNPPTTSPAPQTK